MESKSPSSPPDASQINEYVARLAENEQGFQELMDEMLKVIEEDEPFSEMTPESYNQKKSYMEEGLLDLSHIHNSLAYHYADLVKELKQNQHLESSNSIPSPRVTRGFDALSAVAGVSDDGLEVQEPDKKRVKISNLEEEVASLKRRLRILMDENCVMEHATLIRGLQSDLNSGKFDSIEKLTDEVKLKVEELEREVDKQREAMGIKKNNWESEEQC